MATASMYLGVLESIFGFLVKLFANIIMFVLETVIGLLSGVLYSIGGVLLNIVDFIQELFRKFAGIESIWYNGTETEGDILLYIISEKTVLQVFMALILISVAVLLMGTIIKVIQNEYSTEGANNSKGAIVGSAIKGFFMFIIVPIGVFGGLYASNFILQAIDRATNPSNSGQLGGAVFSASTTEANRFVSTVDTVWDLSSGSTYSEPWASWFADADTGSVTSGALNVSNFESTTDGAMLYDIIKNTDTLSGLSPQEAAQRCAEIIDDWFATKASFSTLTSGQVTTWVNFHSTYINYDTDSTVTNTSSSLTTFDYTSTDQVQNFYRLRDVNFLILYAGGILAAYCMLMAIFGLINRIIKGVIYFMLAPISIASYPFDNGSGLGKWRGTFIKTVLSAYGTVVALNLLFVILPILKNIQLFDPSNILNRTYNSYVYMLLVLCCLLFFKDAPGLVSGLFGGDDATADGKKVAGAVGGAIGKVTPVGKLMGNKVKQFHNSNLSDRLEKRSDKEKAAGNLQEAARLKAKADQKSDISEASRDKARANWFETKSNVSSGLNNFLGGKAYKPKSADDRQKKYDKRIETETKKAKSIQGTLKKYVEDGVEVTDPITGSKRALTQADVKTWTEQDAKDRASSLNAGIKQAQRNINKAEKDSLKEKGKASSERVKGIAEIDATTASQIDKTKVVPKAAFEALVGASSAGSLGQKRRTSTPVDLDKIINDSLGGSSEVSAAIARFETAKSSGRKQDTIDELRKVQRVMADTAEQIQLRLKNDGDRQKVVEAYNKKLSKLKEEVSKMKEDLY